MPEMRSFAKRRYLNDQLAPLYKTETPSQIESGPRGSSSHQMIANETPDPSFCTTQDRVQYGRRQLAESKESSFLYENWSLHKNYNQSKTLNIVFFCRSAVEGVGSHVSNSGVAIIKNRTKELN